ncbi:MAG: HAD family hydrolase [Bdellovibrionales bacterium]|nr:HAD family hydrolase [Bdellovibrionales bacterium]
MKRYKVLLIDLDGTLLGSKKYLLTASFVFFFYLAFREFGIGLSKTISLLKSLRATMEIEGVSNKTNMQRAVELVAAKFHLSPSDAESVLSKKLLWVFKKVKFCFYPFSNIDEVLKTLSQHPNCRLVLATNPAWPKECVYERIRWAGIDRKFFEFVTTSDFMHSVKPSPNYYQELLDRLGVCAADVLMVGDSYKKDAICKVVGIDFHKVTSKGSRVHGFEDLVLFDVARPEAASPEPALSRRFHDL